MAVEDQLERIGNLLEQLVTLNSRASDISKIETMLSDMAAQRAVKEFYSISEIAKIVDRSENQVRRWCVEGRINAQKRACGRGLQQEWMISHEELTTYRSKGLRPAPPRYVSSKA